MSKTPIIVTMSELSRILGRYLDSDSRLNYAIKIVGHPGIGKSDAVRQAARHRNFLFLDTRLAFKENVDLGGYPVPDHAAGQMLYFRPRFIPPEQVPEGYKGIVWFLDEANRAHPTVIQTLFQIISEQICGEHKLPEKTCIVLAGNLGEQDQTTLTSFEDSALDGRLAIFHLKPDAINWLAWAGKENIHPSVMRYIARFPEKLWDEAGIHPNPRGWHQVSQTLRLSFRSNTHEDLAALLGAEGDPCLEKVISALVGPVAAGDFVLHVTAPRQLAAQDVISGDPEKLAMVRQGMVNTEDILWALSGALDALRQEREQSFGPFSKDGLKVLSNVLEFMVPLRADMRASFFYLLLKRCAVFSQIQEALALLEDRDAALEMARAFGRILEEP